MSQVASDTGLVIAAGGGGSRYGTGNKLLEILADVPVLVHALRRLSPGLPPTAIVLVAPETLLPTYRKILQKHGIPATTQLVAGGSSRAESVCNGLQSLPEDLEFVAVQDAARPFTSPVLFQTCLASARQYGSGVAARMVSDTIKLVDNENRVLSTPDRNQLRATETPQIFRLRELLEAYAEAARRGIPVTDEAQVMELAGHEVRLVIHESPNPKLTYSADFSHFEHLANHLLK